ncbi:hypothetical protein MASR1M49_22100 [Pararhodobacter aggregans]
MGPGLPEARERHCVRTAKQPFALLRNEANIRMAHSTSATEAALSEFSQKNETR